MKPQPPGLRSLDDGERAVDSDPQDLPKLPDLPPAPEPAELVATPEQALADARIEALVLVGDLLENARLLATRVRYSLMEGPSTGRDPLEDLDAPLKYIAQLVQQAQAVVTVGTDTSRL